MPDAVGDPIRTAPFTELGASALDAVVVGAALPQLPRLDSDGWRRRHGVANEIHTASVGLPAELGGG